MNSADTQTQSHRCLECQRYVGGELSIDPTAARSLSWARSEALPQFVPLEVVETRRLGPGGGLPLLAVSFLFRFSGPFQRVDVSAAPLPQSFLALSQCVGKRVRRHIEKRELVAAAVGFPTHRHIEEGVGSRRMRFRVHGGHTPSVPCRLQPTIDAGISRTA